MVYWLVTGVCLVGSNQRTQLGCLVVGPNKRLNIALTNFLPAIKEWSIAPLFIRVSVDEENLDGVVFILLCDGIIRR